jgi:hypothetical protein
MTVWWYGLLAGDLPLVKRIGGRRTPFVRARPSSRSDHASIRRRARTGRVSKKEQRRAMTSRSGSQQTASGAGGFRFLPNCVTQKPTPVTNKGLDCEFDKFIFHESAR